MTANGKIAQAYECLMSRLDALVLIPSLPIAGPEVKFDPAVDAPDGKYLLAAFFPNAPRWQGVSSGALDQGLFVVSVMWPKNEGLVRPLEIADQIKGHFPNGLALVSGTTRVKVTGAPWVSAVVHEDVGPAIPVTIPWTA